MRIHLLTTTAAVALLAALPARAQNATWLLNPGSGDFNTAGNWTPATVPTGTAFFGTSNTTALSFSADTTIGGWTLNPGASAYTFTIPSETLQFVGAGIVINGGSVAIANDNGNLNFNNNSAAGSATITNNFFLNFLDASSAGSANITNNFVLTFDGTSSAGSATITNNFILTFDGTSTAGSATITNNGTMEFSANSTAGSANITNNSSLNFFDATSAGSATITNNNGGTTTLFGTSSGGTARLIANGTGAVDFSPLVSAGTTAGSFEGSGNFFLGSKTITVGGNNLSTTVSGVIRDGGVSGGIGGALVKAGTGIMTLSGVNTYTGPTTMNAGAVIVNGSIASSSLTTVNSGAALLGSGTVGSTVINAGGFLVPGPVGVPGNMTVAGNLALQSGAFYVVQVNPTTAATTNVSGTASLAGTVMATFAPGSYVSRSYAILTAAGGVTGTFDALATFGLPPNFGTRLNYTGNTALLNLMAQLVPEPTPPTPPAPPIPPIPGQPSTPGQPPAPPLPTFTVNQLNVGHAIDNFFNNGGALPPAFGSLFGLTGSNLTNALSQLSGEPATGAQKVGFQLTDQFLNLMLDPFVDGRSGVAGADHPALGFAPERETMPPDIAHAYAAVLKPPPKAVPVYEPRWTMWGGAYGGSNRTTGDLAVIGSHDLSAVRKQGGDQRHVRNSVEPAGPREATGQRH
jgi:autotransporter-associated beta strand protein